MVWCDNLGCLHKGEREVRWTLEMSATKQNLSQITQRMRALISIERVIR